MARLSPRQEDCLRGILNLKSAKEIARDLGISPHAVEKHLRASRAKLGASTSAEAARLFAFRETGSEFPYPRASDLAPHLSPTHDGEVLGPRVIPSNVRAGDNNQGPALDQQFTPRQTLLTIAALSLGSIVGLVLLVACAEGIRNLVSH